MKNQLAYFKEIIRTRSRILLALVLFLALNIGLLIYQSLVLEPKVADLQSQWLSRRSTGGVAQDRRAIYEKGNADLERWRSLIPHKKDLARILGELYEVAASNSLTVGGVTFKPDMIKDQGLLTYTIGFNVSGRYASIKSFLADLGNFREMIAVETISLNNQKITEEKVNLKVNLVVYLRAEGK